MPPRARKVDANQPIIVAALRKIGACVIDLSGVGEGVMDLLVIYRGVTHMVEIKNPARKQKANGLTPAQIAKHAEIGRAGGEVNIVRTVGEALALVTMDKP